MVKEVLSRCLDTNELKTHEKNHTDLQVLEFPANEFYVK